MFESQTTIRERLADAVDLMIDFATLGEYGFEPAVEPAPAPCASRRRERRSEPRLAAVDCPDQLPARI